MSEYGPAVDYPEGTRLRVTFEGVVDEDGDLDIGDFFLGTELEYAKSIEVVEPSFMLGDVVQDGNGDVFEVEPPLIFVLLNRSSTRLATGARVAYNALALPVTKLGRFSQ